jgi:hypothetical protein
MGRLYEDDIIAWSEQQAALLLDDPQWLAKTYSRAAREACARTHLNVIPAALPWSAAQCVSHDFWPDGATAAASGATDSPG